MHVCMCVLKSEWLIMRSHPNQNGSSWGCIPPGLEEQFVFIVLEFTDYYKEKCTWHATAYRKYCFL